MDSWGSNLHLEPEAIRLRLFSSQDTLEMSTWSITKKLILVLWLRFLHQQFRGSVIPSAKQNRSFWNSNDTKQSLTGAPLLPPPYFSDACISMTRTTHVVMTPQGPKGNWKQLTAVGLEFRTAFIDDQDHGQFFTWLFKATYKSARMQNTAYMDTVRTSWLVSLRMAWKVPLKETFLALLDKPLRQNHFCCFHASCLLQHYRDRHQKDSPNRSTIGANAPQNGFQMVDSGVPAVRTQRSIPKRFSTFDKNVFETLTKRHLVILVFPVHSIRYNFWPQIIPGLVITLQHSDRRCRLPALCRAAHASVQSPHNLAKSLGLFLSWVKCCTSNKNLMYWNIFLQEHHRNICWICRKNKKGRIPKNCGLL